jgi:hypothetical protein
MATVSEHDFTEIEGSFCADHLSSKSFFDQLWDKAAVVNVGMSEYLNFASIYELLRKIMD